MGATDIERGNGLLGNGEESSGLSQKQKWVGGGLLLVCVAAIIAAIVVSTSGSNDEETDLDKSKQALNQFLETGKACFEMRSFNVYEGTRDQFALSANFMGLAVFNVGTWVPNELVESFTFETVPAVSSSSYIAQVRNEKLMKWSPVNEQMDIQQDFADYVSSSNGLSVRFETMDSPLNLESMSICINSSPKSEVTSPTNLGGIPEGCVGPNGFFVRQGMVPDSQTLVGLSTNEMSSYGDAFWEKYMEIVPSNNNGAVVDFTFPSNAVLNGVSLYVNGRTAKSQDQTYTFKLYDNGSSYKTIGTTTSFEDWMWHNQTFGVTSFTSPNTNTTLTVRVETNGNSHGLLLDSICVVYDVLPGAPTFAPTVAPTSALQCNVDTAHWQTWTFQSLICGIQLEHNATSIQMDVFISDFVDEGCTTIMVDTRLSYYLTETEFQEDLDAIAAFTAKANAQGLKTVIYFPSTEIITKNGVDENVATAARDHPDWLQVGLNGDLNVFYGAEVEHWVGETEESAWCDPESDPYLLYLMGKIYRLAETGVNGLWMDVPIYYEGSNPLWAGGSTYSLREFTAYTKSKGYCNAATGCTSLPDMPGTESLFSGDPKFNYWQEWRHYSLARFLDRIKNKAKEANPDIVVFAENYPADYADATLVGLDAAFYLNREGLSNVYEIDSVSNTGAMLYSSHEDFANQLTMRKYIKSVDRWGVPTWAFCYGNTPIDSQLVLSAAFATANGCLETKTPAITESVSSASRTQMFTWAKQHLCDLYQTERFANVAILYSSRTRDFNDVAKYAGGYGMYNDFTPNPSNDEYWWASTDFDSALQLDHIGDYRGASYAAQLLHLQYKFVMDEQLTAEDLGGIKFLWIPSALCLSSQALQIITTWVQQGGTVLVTGLAAGRYDEFGLPRGSNNPFEKDIFQTSLLPGVVKSVSYGAGQAIYRGDLNPKQFFINENNQGYGQAEQTAALNILTPIVFNSVPQYVQISTPHIFVETSLERDIIYLVNYNGLQQPLITSLQTVQITYTPKTIPATLTVSTPSTNAVTKGLVPFTNNQDGTITFSITIDQIALVTLS